MPESKPLECPGCGIGDAEVLFQSSNGYPIVRCRGCALVFTDTRMAPPPSTLYPAFEQSDSGLPKVMRTALGVFTRQREKLVRSVKPAGRLLDFGCGSGAFARWMSEAGYDVVGLEPFSLGQPVETERLLLVREPLESAAARLGKFDVITMWHVLEHLSRPVELLKRLAEMLTPTGVLIVSVPNFQSWQSQVFRGSWFHLDPPRHVIHFESETLDNCLRKAGLRTMQRWDFLPEYGTSGWIQSALNEVLPHKNYIYEVVKDRGALRGLGPLAHGLHIATSFAAGVPALAFSLPIEAIASSAGKGAALTFAATRADVSHA